MVRTGMRQIEARTFPDVYVFDPTRRRDLNPDQKIRVTLNSKDMRIKFSKSRDIDVPYDLMEKMWAYSVRHRQGRANSHPEGAEFPPLFLTEGGVPYTKGAVVGIFATLSKRVGFKVEAHMLRHTYATYLLWSLRKSTKFEGDPLLYVRDRLGHSDVSTTTDYLHLVNSLEGQLVLAHDYLMPSMGHRILHAMERWSAPYRQRLAEQSAAMEQKTSRPTPKELQWLATARSNTKRLFLGYGKSGIVPMSGSSWGNALKSISRAAGASWVLAPHQMRRLYAYTFVRHKLGDLLFLKEQFKHSSIDMSQLYGSNPRQDRALYDDILSELMRYKGEVIATWLEKDEPLAGGAGRKIMEMRAHEFPDRKALVTEASRRVVMRSNGHAWCLAQDDGCGGSGIYAKGSCGSCRNGLVDRRFVPIWQEAYRHHTELLMDAQQWGPGAIKRVSADLEQAASILRDLGITPEGASDGKKDGTN